MNTPGMRRRAPRAVAVAALAVAPLGTVVTAVALGSPGDASSPTSTPTAAAPEGAQASAPAAVAGSAVRVTAATVPPAREPVAPVAVVIAAAGIALEVVPVGVDPDGAMELPADPAVAGWYEYGADVTATEGNVVLAAHVDATGYGIGPFAELRDLPVGAEVTVTGADGGERTFVIESVTFHAKTVLPIDALFARDGPPGLVLMTCGGPYDAASGSYRDNVVALARPR